MNIFTNSNFGRNLLKIIAVIFLCTALFEWWYWQGKRTNRQISGEESGLAKENAFRGQLTSAMNIPIPANANPETREYLQNRTVLMQKMTELHRSHSNGPLDLSLIEQFKRDNAHLLQRQQDLTQIIAQQQVKNPHLEQPPLQIPPNASPQLKAYLIAHDQLKREQIEFMNQHQRDDPLVRQAAMQEWRQQNAARFQELQREVDALIKTKQT